MQARDGGPLRHLAARAARRRRARAAERLDPPGRSARRPVLPRRRRDARPPHRHGREPRDRRLHPLALRAPGPEAGRAERLVLRDVQPDDGDARARRSGERARDRRRGRPGAPAARGAGILPASVQRERRRGGAGRLRRIRDQRAASRLRRLPRRRTSSSTPRRIFRTTGRPAIRSGSLQALSRTMPPGSATCSARRACAIRIDERMPCSTA